MGGLGEDGRVAVIGARAVAVAVNRGGGRRGAFVRRPVFFKEGRRGGGW